MGTDAVTMWDMYLTLVCSLLSLIGSTLVLFSYMVTKSTANPRAAQLICNLALTDFVWFLSAFVQTLFWATDNPVPAALCFIVGPLVNFCRLASLMWTCAISIDVLMSVKHRKWTRHGEEGERQSVLYKRIYFAMVILFASPNFIITIVLQHGSKDNSDLGCNAGYEEIGDALAVFFTDILPIAIGFMVNVYVFIVVRSTMNQKAYPQSVRKRRRKIMYHYVIVCIVSWTPTIAHYILEVCGIKSAALEVTARGSLYLTGFLNFLVFGMQDPHLSRSLAIMVYTLGGCIICGGNSDEAMTPRKSALRIKEEQKSVMFTGHMEEGADITKDKKDIYKYHKLSEEDKASLYRNRPDLNPRLRIATSKQKKPKRLADSGAADASPLLGMDDEEDGTDSPGEKMNQTAGSTPRHSNGRTAMDSQPAVVPIDLTAAGTSDTGAGADALMKDDNTLSEPLLAQQVSEGESSIERQLKRSISGDRYRLDRMKDRLGLGSGSGSGSGPFGGAGRGEEDDDDPAQAVNECKNDHQGGASDGEGDAGIDLESGGGFDTPATVSFDSRDGSVTSGQGGTGYFRPGDHGGDSSSDEGDEEDDALELPVGGRSNSGETQ